MKSAKRIQAYKLDEKRLYRFLNRLKTKHKSVIISGEFLDPNVSYVTIQKVTKAFSGSEVIHGALHLTFHLQGGKTEEYYYGLPGIAAVMVSLRIPINEESDQMNPIF